MSYLLEDFDSLHHKTHLEEDHKKPKIVYFLELPSEESYRFFLPNFALRSL